MAQVRIVGLKGGGRYVVHEVPPQKTTGVIEKLKEDPSVIAVESRLLLPPIFRFSSNIKY